MVCREYRLSSVVIAQVRTASWMDDAQIQSLYHLALHDPMLFGGMATGWDRDALVQTVITNARNDLRYNPTYRRQRRQGLTARLQEGEEAAIRDMPTERLSALARLHLVVESSQAATRERLREIAGHRGMSEREALEEFSALRAEAPGGRQPRATAEERADLGTLPSDFATRYALQEMTARPPRRTPMPTIDTWVRVDPTTLPAGATNPIVEVGTAEDSRRVELRYRDGTIQARELSDQDSVEIPRTRNLPHTVAASLMALPELTRPQAGAYKVRCDDCGQFSNNRHTCPVGIRDFAGVDSDVTNFEGATLTMASVAGLQRLSDENPGDPLMTEITYLPTQGHGRVHGRVLVRANGEAVRLDGGRRQFLDLDDVAGDSLQCSTCGSNQCRHVGEARALVRRQLAAAGLMPTLAEHDASLPDPTDLSNLIARDRPTPETTTSTPPELTAATVNLADEPELFRQLARDGHRDGVDLLPAGTFNGFAASARPGGTTFGIEIEYNNLSASIVGNELHDAGILRSSYQEYYGRGRGDLARWRFERDSSVGQGGELITPVLRDDERAWTEIQRVCQVLNENGASTDWAGSHTNIGVGEDYTAADAWRLAHLIRAHEDDIFRMGRTRRSRRHNAYNYPLREVPVQQWSSTQARAQGRECMVNFSWAFSGADNARIEFRFPDASLNPAVIQAQARLGAAMLGYSRAGNGPIGEHRPVGSALSAGRGRTVSLGAAEFDEQTRPIRGLIDALFTTDEERAQMAQLWGRGSFYRD